MKLVKHHTKSEYLLWARHSSKYVLCIKDLLFFFIKGKFCAEYEGSFPKVIECLEGGFEDSIQFYVFDRLNSRKIASTNTLERLNWKTRRWSTVIGIFPTTDSYIRLIICLNIQRTDSVTKAP